MSKPDGVGEAMLRAVYAEQFSQQAAEIERLRTTIVRQKADLEAAYKQIEDYKNIVFKMQMKLDAAEAPVSE